MPFLVRKTGGSQMAANNVPNERADAFLTVAEVASMMRVSKMTVYRLVHSGELAAVQVGRSFRIRESDAHKYLSASYYHAG